MKLAYFFVVILLLCKNDNTLADGVTIGTEQWSKDSNLLDLDHPVAAIVGSGVVSYLTRREGTSPEVHGKLELVDMVKVLEANSGYRFRLKERLQFGNGAKVTSADVVASLNRCIDNGKLKGVGTVSAAVQYTQSGERQDWLEIKNDPTAAHGAGSKPTEIGPLLLDLAGCPIVWGEGLRIFGSKFAQGTNLVSLGQYSLVANRSGSLLELAKNISNSSVLGAPDSIRVRAYRTPAERLSALRAGTIDLFFEPSAEVKQSIESDSTLSLAQCGRDQVVYRRSLGFSCQSGRLDVTSIKVNN